MKQNADTVSWSRKTCATNLHKTDVKRKIPDPKIQHLEFHCNKRALTSTFSQRQTALTIGKN